VRHAIAAFTAAVTLALTPPVAFAGDQLRVTVQAANVRQRPTTQSPAIVSVPKDTRLPALEHAGHWVKVEIVDRKGERKTGFIHDSLGTVEPSTEIPSEAPLPAASPPERSVVADPPIPSVSFTEPSRPGIRPQPAEPPPIVAPRAGAFQSAPSRVAVEGGLLAASGNAGFLIGGGYVSFPFGDDEISVQGDGHFLRFNRMAGFAGSGNLAQYFHVPNLPFTPFAGAGILVLKSGADSHVGFQLLFGFDRSPIGHYTLGVQIRTLFVSGGPVTVLLGHVSMSKTTKN
jgi:hypothetical protein